MTVLYLGTDPLVLLGVTWIAYRTGRAASIVAAMINKKGCEGLG